MIDFLKDYNIAETTIEQLKKTQSPSFLFDLNCNEEECVKIINYLREIGINNIDELLLYESEIFFKTKKNVEIAFLNCDKEELVELINEDDSNIEELYDYL